MPTKSYYAHFDDSEYGPFSVAELQDMAGDGEIPAHAMIREDSSTSLIEARRMPELQAFLKVGTEHRFELPSPAPVQHVPAPPMLAPPMFVPPVFVPPKKPEGNAPYELASLIPRFMAFCVDLLLFIFFLAIVLSILAPEWMAESGNSEDLATQAFIRENNWMRYASWALLGLVSAGFTASSLRASPGKQLFGLIVVRKDGAKIGLFRCVGRELLRYFPLITLFSILAMLQTRFKQGFHDIMVGSVVVTRKSVEEREAWAAWQARNEAMGNAVDQ